MTDKVDLKALREPKPTGGGTTEQRLARLDDETRALVLDWLNDPNIGPVATARKLTGAGFEIHDTTVARWRRRQATRNG